MMVNFKLSEEMGKDVISMSQAPDKKYLSPERNPEPMTFHNTAWMF